MTTHYWNVRENEILAFRDYALSFDLSGDLAEGVWLAESGDQLLEIAFQLFFIGYSTDSIRLAEKAIEYYLAALGSESTSPKNDPAMAHVYHGLYYARWWVTEQEPIGILRQAATAYSAGLGQPLPTENANSYVRMVWLWLELGEIEQADDWLSLTEWVKHQTNSSSVDTTLLRQIIAIFKKNSNLSIQQSDALSEAVMAASAWGTPTANTLWYALQLVNIRRRVFHRNSSLSDLLDEIR